MQGQNWFISIVFMVGIIIFPLENISGQILITEYRKVADSLMFDLKEGALIVRLRSHTKNLKSMEEDLKNPKTKNKKQVKKLIKSMKKELKRFNSELTKGFYDHYTFSDFYITYDTSFHLLNSGVKKGYFLNENLEIDEEITLNTNNYLIIDEGPIPADLRFTFSVGMMVRDSEHNHLFPPFPMAFRIIPRAPLDFLGVFFGLNPYPYYSGNRIVSAIQKRFDIYYTRILRYKRKNENNE